jgi:hypothetical protein
LIATPGLKRDRPVHELLDRIRQEISTRMAELRPLIDEHARLDAAMLALGEAPKRAAAAPPASSPRQAKARPRKPPVAQRRKRAPAGSNREAVLRAARERPGATAAELAAVSKVDRNTLNTLLARLVKAGELRKRALPTGRAGYVLGDATPAASTPADEQVAGVSSTDAT